MKITLSPADITLMSALLSMLLGTIVVPWVVAAVVHTSWSVSAKRFTAVCVSLVVGTAQFLIEQVWTGQVSVGSIAIMAPIIYVLATTSYDRYWKPILGPIEELDLVGRILKPKE